LCQSGGGCHADPDALENRARPPFPGAPTSRNVFACSEHAVGRAGYIGARLVGKVKDHSVSRERVEVVARMTRCPPQCSVQGSLRLWNRGCFHGLHAIVLTHCQRQISGRNFWQESAGYGFRVLGFFVRHGSLTLGTRNCRQIVVKKSILSSSARANVNSCGNSHFTAEHAKPASGERPMPRKRKSA
jgi:hypothetical protein